MQISEFPPQSEYLVSKLQKTFAIEEYYVKYLYCKNVLYHKCY